MITDATGATQVEPRDIFDQRYRRLSHLAMGRSGEIYLAEDMQTLRVVVVKIINPRIAQLPGFDNRFRQAAEQLKAAPDLENIPRLFDYRIGPDCSYLVMEWIQGESLAAYLRHAPHGLDPIVAANIYTQIGRALAAAHRCGIVHGYVNPTNIIICSHKQDSRFVRLMGFGLCPRVERRPPFTQAPLAAYLAPEQAHAALRQQDLPCTPASDQFALAVIAYEMLIGRPVFWQPGDDTRDVLRRLCTQDPDVFAIKPRYKEEALLQAMSRDPNLRHPSVDTFLRALDSSGAETVSISRVDIEDLTDLAEEQLSAPRSKVTGTAILEQNRPAPVSYRQRVKIARLWLAVVITALSAFLVTTILVLIFKGTSVRPSVPAPGQASISSGHSDAGVRLPIRARQTPPLRLLDATLDKHPAPRLRSQEKAGR